MVKTGSQVLHCSNPIHFDTYKGCSHGCDYCFAKKKNNISDIKIEGGWRSVKEYIEGRRNQWTRWNDKPLPIHFGALSDPYQYIEKKMQRTKEVMQWIKRNAPNYPVILSTKGTELLKRDYSIFDKMNITIQISMLCPEYDNIEKGAPTFNERLRELKEIRKHCKRLIVRLQPYKPEYLNSIIKYFSEYKNVGVYGVIVEGYKSKTIEKWMVKTMGDCSYTCDKLKTDYNIIKKEAHNKDLVFLCAENRLRDMGDSLNCCGTDGLDGFITNDYNITNYLFNKKAFHLGLTAKMKEVGTADVFGVFEQTGAFFKGCNEMSYKECIDLCCRDYNYLNILLQKK